MRNDIQFLRRLIVAYLTEMTPGQAGMPGGGCAPNIGECMDFYANVVAATEKKEQEDAVVWVGPTPSEEPQGPEAPPTHTHTHGAAPDPDGLSGEGIRPIEPKPSPAREAAQFKRDTLARLKEYRERNGLGCFKQLARSARDKKVTEAVLHQMINGEKHPVELWRAVAKALDKEDGFVAIGIKERGSDHA